MNLQNNSCEIDPIYRLLALCARAEGHPLFYEQLKEQLLEFKAWDGLPAQAEIHGMAPLLWYHIHHHSGFSIPQKTEQTLKGLYLRQRYFIQAHTQVLLEINSLFKGAGIRAVVLKGLGLAYQYYPESALRPVSDIDLLFKQEDVLPALHLMESSGFQVSFPSPTLKRLPKELIVNSPMRYGVSVKVEVHHHAPGGRSTFDNSLDEEFMAFDAQPHTVVIGESTVYVPDPMDTLNYLLRHFTRHMFVAPSSNYLPLKWVADIISLVERHAETMDWDFIRKQNPTLLKRLEVLYSLTPLPHRLITVIPIRQIPPPAGVGQYPQGWPQQVNWGWKTNGFPYYIWRSLTSPTYIWNTLNVPSDWWLRLYYGIDADSIFWYGQVIYRYQVLKMALWKLISQN